MPQLQLILVVLGLAREMFKYMSKRIDSKTERVERVKEFKNTLKEANKNDGKTNDTIERAFSDLKLLDKRED